MRALLVPLLLAGCVPAATQPAGEVGECTASNAQYLVGRQHSEALSKEALKRTGTGVVRLIRPGQAVTMDYRTDRLNIEIDERDKVIRITCG
jgi:hypothetical protein